VHLHCTFYCLFVGIHRLASALLPQQILGFTVYPKRLHAGLCFAQKQAIRQGDI
jgi:hypothetical protein